MLILYLVCIKVFDNKKYALLVCFATGFTIGVIQIATFLRMYQLFMLNSLLLLYWHLCNKDKKDLKFKNLLSLFVIVVVGFLTHYYFSIIAVALFIVHFIRNLKNKNYKLLLKYSLTLVTTVIVSTIIFPAWIDHIFYGYRGEEAFFHFTKMSLNIFINLLRRFIIKISFDGFNDLAIIILGLLCIFIIVAIIFKFKNKIKIFETVNVNMVYIWFTMVFYVLIVMWVVPYIELRYISPVLIYIIIIFIYYLKKFGEVIYQNKNSLFKILCVVFITISIVNVVKIDNGMFIFKEDKESLNKIKIESNNKKLIYVRNENSVDIYNQYLIFLMYDESIVIKDNEFSEEMLEQIMLEKGLKKEDCVIAFDASSFIKLRNMNKLDNFNFMCTFAKSVFMAYVK